MPATPMATSAMPCRQARPNRVRDHHGHLDAGVFGERLTEPPAEASGPGKQADGVVARNVRGVYARVGADETVVGLRDDDARSMRTMRRLSLSTTSIWRGSFP